METPNATGEALSEIDGLILALSKSREMFAQIGGALATGDQRRAASLAIQATQQTDRQGQALLFAYERAVETVRWVRDELSSGRALRSDEVRRRAESVLSQIEAARAGLRVHAVAATNPDESGKLV